jgi:hypothetical protein
MKLVGLLIPPLIINIDDKVCSNCKFYNKIVTYYDVIHGDHDYDGRCERFGEKNIVTGEIHYQLASIRRQENNLCKKKGKFFTPNS